MTQVATRPAVREAHDVAPGDLPERSWWRWFDVELATKWCVLSWVVATALFVLFTMATGGPATIDEQESVYSTWAIAHGDFQCAFPSQTLAHEPLIAPVYPILSGGVAALTGIGHDVPFPSQAAMGPNCDKADAAIRAWALRSGSFGATRVISFAGWVVLLGGIVAWLRASGRGRTRWEAATVVAFGALPVVSACIETCLHPQDLMAMGLGLGAMALARRDRWGGAGMLIALAVLSQQFALLLAAPLFVLAPATRRLRFAAFGAGAAVIFVAPMVLLSAGNVIRAIAIGSGDNGSIGGTLMWELSHRGMFVVLGSRMLPIALALVASYAAVRRFRLDRSSPVVMMALVAVSLSLRLVFEQNIFEYYFMALSVALILLDVTRGHIRGSVAVWLSTIFMAYRLAYIWRVARFVRLQTIAPDLVIIAALVVVAVHLANRRHWDRWNVALWSCVLADFLMFWPSGDNPFAVVPPNWLVQGTLSITGLMLAAAPILEIVRVSRRDHPTTTPLVPAFSS